MNREARVTAGCMLLLLIGFTLGIGHAPTLHANYNNITQTDVQNVIHAGALGHGSTLTQTLSFKPLPKTINQAAQFQVTGTSPNYKVEVLCCMDGTNFTKPETGGDLGTFTDGNMHYVALGTPLSAETKLKFTELGGVNDQTVEASEASQ